MTLQSCKLVVNVLFFIFFLQKSINFEFNDMLLKTTNFACCFSFDKILDINMFLY